MPDTGTMSARHVTAPSSAAGNLPAVCTQKGGGAQIQLASNTPGPTTINSKRAWALI